MQLCVLGDSSNLSSSVQFFIFSRVVSSLPHACKVNRRPGSSLCRETRASCLGFFSFPGFLPYFPAPVIALNLALWFFCQRWEVFCSHFGCMAWHRLEPAFRLQALGNTNKKPTRKWKLTQRLMQYQSLLLPVGFAPESVYFVLCSAHRWLYFMFLCRDDMEW